MQKTCRTHRINELSTGFLFDEHTILTFIYKFGRKYLYFKSCLHLVSQTSKKVSV